MNYPRATALIPWPNVAADSNVNTLGPHAISTFVDHGPPTGVTLDSFNPTTIRLMRRICVACRAIRLVYSNVNGSGATLAINASVVIDGVYYPAMFSGQPSVTLTADQIATSDPIVVSIAALQVIDIRTYVNSADGTVPSNVNGNYINPPDLAWGNRTIAKDTIDYTASEPVGGWVGMTSYGYGPSLVLGDALTDDVASILFLGDSTLAFDSGLVYLMAGNFPSVNAAFSGASTPTGALAYADLFASCSHALIGYGVNDFNGYDDAATLKSRILALGATVASYGLTWQRETISPKTTSTDTWATIANQSRSGLPDAWQSGHARDVYNADVRASDELYLDYAALCEETIASGLWLPGCTADGTHLVTGRKVGIAGSYQTVLQQAVLATQAQQIKKDTVIQLVTGTLAAGGGGGNRGGIGIGI